MSANPESSTHPNETHAAADAVLPELGHVVLFVSDLERSTAFYGEVLGWRSIPRPDGMPARAFSSGRTHHELLLIEVGPDAQPIPSGRRVGMYHFGVKIGDHDDDLRAMRDRLSQFPDLVRMVGQSDHGVTHSLYVQDPDGNEVELYVDVPDVDWRNDPSLFNQPVRPLDL
jgi:catechol 2,3-dioxygenase